MESKKILIASSDETSIKKIYDPLQRAGYDISISDDGEEALELIQNINPLAIVAELNLPKLSGLELCWAVRNRYKLNHIPFIILSNSNNKEIELNSYRSGVDGILIKPISAREFMVRVEALVSRFQVFANKGISRLSVFNGELGEFLLLELIQWLHNNSKSGRLWLSNLYQRGSIYLYEGKIVQSKLDDLEGEEAIYRMFSWKTGKFEFEIGEEPKTTNIKKSTIEILLECSKRMDEQERTFSFSHN